MTSNYRPVTISGRIYPMDGERFAPGCLDRIEGDVLAIDGHEVRVESVVSNDDGSVTLSFSEADQ